jgi:hypothetical protein
MSFTIRNDDGDEIEVAEHMFLEVYEPQGYKRVSASEKLGKLTRDELNTYAENAGIDDPAHYQNKDALIEAIEARELETLQGLEEHAEATMAVEPAEAAGDVETGEAAATDDA